MSMDPIDREIARLAALTSGLTREDFEIIACDYLNPQFGLRAGAEAALRADRRDAAIMTRLTDLPNSFTGGMRPAQRLYWHAQDFPSLRPVPAQDK